MHFFFITANPDVARFAIDGGVDYIFVDLEINGKIERQGHLNTVISKHTLEDVRRVRSVVPQNKLLVRINPLNQYSAVEIDQVVNAGADSIMLPMFTSAKEVCAFVDLVAGRARCCLLVETVSAVMTHGDWLSVQGIDQVHIGLNDLHLELGHDFMFEPLANGMLDDLCKALRASRKAFGIGGLARAGEGLLPADLLLAEHVRLGSTWAILSRTFHRQAASVVEIKSQMDFPKEVSLLREAYYKYQAVDHQHLEDARRQINDIVNRIVSSARQGKRDRLQ